MNHNLPVVVVKAYDLVLWSIRKVEKFPRSHRHQVGDRLVDAALGLLLCLVDATYSRDKAGLLAAANGATNRLCRLLRRTRDLTAGICSVTRWRGMARSFGAAPWS